MLGIFEQFCFNINETFNLHMIRLILFILNNYIEFSSTVTIINGLKVFLFLFPSLQLSNRFRFLAENDAVKCQQLAKFWVAWRSEQVLRIWLTVLTVNTVQFMLIMVILRRVITVTIKDMTLGDLQAAIVFDYLVLMKQNKIYTNLIYIYILIILNNIIFKISTTTTAEPRKSARNGRNS